MITDRLLAFFSLVGFFAFLVVAVIFVGEFDIFVILTLAFALVSFDFWKILFRSDAGQNGST